MTHFKHRNHFTVLNAIFWGLLIWTNVPTLRADENKPSDIFIPDSLYVEAGYGASALSPNYTRLNNGIFYYNTFYGYTRNLTNNQDWNLYHLYTNYQSKTESTLISKGYLRSEMSIGRYLSFGALLRDDVLHLKNIPYPEMYTNGEFHNQLFFYLQIIRDGAGVNASPLYNHWITASYFKKSRSISITGFEPEIGLHYSFGSLEAYVRVSGALLDHNEHISAHRSSANIGLRALVYDPFTLHLEAYASRWGISSSRGPDFDTKFNEYGGRFGIGVRLQHP